MTKIDIKEIAKKWQDKWAEKWVYKTSEDPSKKKFFALDMFPYPSGAGLHVGHPKGYLATDVISRKKQLEGYSVLHPMGFDAFGLPTEQYAITHKIHPNEATDINIARFKEQLKSMGFNYDWDRQVSTADPKFYKWTQWMFLQMYKSYFDHEEQKAKPISELKTEITTYVSQNEENKPAKTQNIKEFLKWYKNNWTGQESDVDQYIDTRRLAFIDFANINWCPVDKTALANEDLEDGKCERCGSAIEIKKMRQWMIRIPEYAQRLIDGLEELPEWQSNVKEIQRNWIGRSEGTQFVMNVAQENLEKTSQQPGKDFFVEIARFAGKNYLIDEKVLEKYHREYEMTADGFVEVVWSVIKNEKWEYLMMHDKQFNAFYSAGGKVDKWEDFRHALLREIKEELGVDCSVWDYMWGIKFVHNGRNIKMNYYQVTLMGEPSIQENDSHHGFERVWVEKFDNELWYVIKVNNNIVDGAEHIRQVFASTFIYESLLKDESIDQKSLAEGQFHMPVVIDEKKKYITYFAKKTWSYHVMEEGELPWMPSDLFFEVYTTRIDTVFGMSYVALAPENELVKKITTDSCCVAVEQYVEATSHKTELQRIEDKTKTWVFTGSYAINPFTGDKVQIWVADYVLNDFGTGAVMAVPAHDERDWEFAKKYDLPIIQSIAPYFPVTTGKDAIKHDQPFDKRKNVHVLLKNDNSEYCMLDWWKYGWKSMIIGWVDAGEDIIAAAKREILEETGYKNIEFVEQVWWEQHSVFFAEHKNVNRYSVEKCLVFSLLNNEKNEISDEESSKHTLRWIKSDEIWNFINIDNEKYFRKHYQKWLHAHTEKWIVINSGEFSDLESDEAISCMQVWLEERNLWWKKINFRIADWCFSRQRYWGEPFPMIHHPDGSIVTMDERELPLTLPDVTHYEPTGAEEGPLAAIDDWINVKLPDGTMGKRESNTMPGRAGSSWYWLRYMDPHNEEFAVGKQAESYRWQVDVYVWGMEHAARHLIYARFWHKFLFDIGVVSTSEPFKKLQTVGLVMAEDGRKMSKRRWNVINPDDVIAEVGSDAFRTYEMFMWPFDNEIAWNTQWVKWVKKFLDKFAGLIEKVDTNYQEWPELVSLLHQTIKKIGDDIDSFKFNTAVSQLMIVVNTLVKEAKISDRYLEKLILLIAPFAPHLAEEMWSILGHESMVFESAQRPSYDESLIVKDTVTMWVQFNGKVRGTIDIWLEASQEEAMELVRKDGKLSTYVPAEVKKVIYVKGKILNVVG